MEIITIVILCSYSQHKIDQSPPVLLVSGFISRFVEPVRLFPAGVKAHGCFVLQELVHAAGSDGWAAGESLLLGVAHCRDRQSLRAVEREAFAW